MTRTIFLAPCLFALTACGSSQPAFDALQSDAVALLGEQNELNRTKWAIVRDLSGKATYDGTADFKAFGTAVPDTKQVRGQMSLDVDFDQNRPVIDGTIDRFISEDDQSLSGSLTFEVEDSTFVRDPNKPIDYVAELSGTMQAPGTENVENVTATIAGTFVGEQGEFIAGWIGDSAGPMQIQGNYAVKD